MQEASHGGPVPGAAGPERRRAAQAGERDKQWQTSRAEGQEKCQRPPIAPRRASVRARGQIEATTCETDSYLPPQGCVGLHRS